MVNVSLNNYESVTLLKERMSDPYFVSNEDSLKLAIEILNTLLDQVRTHEKNKMQNKITKLEELQRKK